MKKILIITYYWPPSGGGGVQRWLKFAKYLPEFGWEPIIFTPENPDFDIKDPSLLKEINPDLEVLKLPIWEPYQLFEKLSGKKRPSQGLMQSAKKKSWLTELAIWIRGNLLIPDPRKYWVKPSVKFLLGIIRDNAIDVVVTTGPPHSMHLIGLQLKKKLAIRWIADFRDPWSKWDMLDNFKLSKWARRRHKKLESKILQFTDEVITVSETWSKEFNEIQSRNYKIITNGYDQDDFSNVQSKQAGDKFVISHFGLINDFRNPEIFWNCIKSIATTNNIEIRLFGTIEARIKEFVMSDEVLKEIVVFRPPVSHEEVLKAYSESDVLLLLLNNSDNAKGHIPGKLFEYLASHRIIVALGPTNGDAAKIIANCNAGIAIDWSNEALLMNKLQAIINGEILSSPNLDIIQRYSRKYLTNRLVNEVLN